MKKRNTFFSTGGHFRCRILFFSLHQEILCSHSLDAPVEFSSNSGWRLGQAPQDKGLGASVSDASVESQHGTCASEDWAAHSETSHA